jgi:hypothetical protein
VAFATNAAVVTSSASIGIEVVVVDVAKVVDDVAAVVVDVAKVVDDVAAVVVVRRRITGIINTSIFHCLNNAYC